MIDTRIHVATIEQAEEWIRRLHRRTVEDAERISALAERVAELERPFWRRRPRRSRRR